MIESSGGLLGRLLGGLGEPLNGLRLRRGVLGDERSLERVLFVAWLVVSSRGFVAWLVVSRRGFVSGHRRHWSARSHDGSAVVAHTW